MKRHKFIAFIASSAAALSQSARAQQRMRRIGVLMAHLESDPEFQTIWEHFEMVSSNLGRSKGATSESMSVGARSTTLKEDNNRRRNLLPCSRISSLRKTRLRLRRCFNKRARSLSFS